MVRELNLKSDVLLEHGFNADFIHALHAGCL